jgi:outer membrane receptor for ferric coprogen and ferric-rhodotorulic acid
MLPDSLPGGNPEGQGEDVGLNFTLLQGKLHARAVYYKSGTIRAQGQHGFGSTNTNPTVLTTRIVDGLVAAGLITSAEGDSHRVSANAILFDTTSEGYEFSLTANPSRNWRLQANYSNTTNFEENIGNELVAWAAQELAYFRGFPQDLPISGGTIASVIGLFEENMETQFAVEGEELRSNRKHKANFVTRYSFSTGRLKGLFIGGGYRFQSKNIGGRTPLPERAPIMGRAISVADAFAGYTIRRVPLLGQVRMQLNVANLFDNDEPLQTLFFADGSVRRVVRVAPRTWRLSANVEF